MVMDADMPKDGTSAPPPRYISVRATYAYFKISSMAGGAYVPTSFVGM